MTPVDTTTDLPRSELLLEWPEADSGHYRVLVKDEPSQEYVMKVETDEPRLALQTDDLDPARRYTWRPQARDEAGRWYYLLPEVRLERAVPSGAPITPLALPRTEHDLHRVIIRDHVAGEIVIKDATFSSSYLVDWAELDASHLHRYRLQQWTGEAWEDCTPYEWLYPPAAATDSLGFISSPMTGASVRQLPLGIHGWALFGGGTPISRVEITLGGCPLGIANIGLPTPEVAEHYPHPSASESGFGLLVPGRFLTDVDHEFRVGGVVHAADGRTLTLDDVTVRRGNEVFDLTSHRLESMERELDAWRYMQWLERLRPSSDRLVSVVIPSRNRGRLLRRCIDSVLAQVHSTFEVIVVDDGSDDDTPTMLAQITDPRVRKFRKEQGGVCAARNYGLQRATGSVVCYLDDDNIMHPLWLLAVAHTFDRFPETTVLYGARIIDDDSALKRLGAGGLPHFNFRPFERKTLERGNIVDTNVIAHVAGHPEGYFDEELSQYGDWDLFLRLTRNDPPRELPAIACLYSTDGHGRLSDQDLVRLDKERLAVIEKHGLRGQ